MSAADAGGPRPRPVPDIADLDFVSYADFGARFVRTAVTRERVEEAVAKLAGRPIDVGPLGVGPLGLVKVRADGAVGEPVLSQRDGDEVAFDLAIPAQLAMLVEIGIDRHHFDATITIRLALTVRTAAPLRLVIDVAPPSSSDVEVDVTAGGLRSSVLQILGGVDGEVRRSVAKYVRREIEKPSMQEQRIIDVEAALNRMSKPTPD